MSSDICGACGQTVAPSPPTIGLDLVLGVRIPPGVLVSRGHVYTWVLQILDRWYSEHSYDNVATGELINVSQARQEPNGADLRR